MAKGITIQLTGALPAETAKALLTRLAEIGKQVERMDSTLAAKIGPASGLVCRLLSRNGVFVVSIDPALTPEGEVLAVEIDPSDTPDFAAEKILDNLSDRGLVSFENADYSPEEEEEVRQRLADLGYIE
jgi:hypothetical protein